MQFVAGSTSTEPRSIGLLRQVYCAQVLHLELDLAGSGMEYQPGDSLGVTALNEDGLVDALLARLGANGSSRFEVVPADGSGAQQGLLPHLGCPTSLRHALQAGCDLTSVPRYPS